MNNLNNDMIGKIISELPKIVSDAYYHLRENNKATKRASILKLVKKYLKERINLDFKEIPEVHRETIEFFMDDIIVGIRLAEKDMRKKTK